VTAQNTRREGAAEGRHFKVSFNTHRFRSISHQDTTASSFPSELPLSDVRLITMFQYGCAAFQNVILFATEYACAKSTRRGGYTESSCVDDSNFLPLTFSSPSPA
jgi:hypothetical protein